MDRRAEQVEANENSFRQVNERIAELGDQQGMPLEFVCECNRIECTERVAVSADDYEAVRAHGDRFIVAPGHERSEYEVVIHERPDYLIVKKLGEVGEEASRDNPRTP